MISKLALVPMAALGLTLTACSSEPSEAEMLQAVSRFTSNLYQQQAAAMAFVVGPSRGGAPQVATITDFRKLDCEPARGGAAGHDCQFEMTMNNGKGEMRDRAPFFRAADGSLAMSIN
ncbi:hypothetical protein [Methylobacterium sp. R2-1]|uniref:hypothetical protein n=1 Tax=Methylobacterium sp. R2-1 TaxID=2587064 RepID=UPI0016190645|nr:hypothetical protein [Methylobacterium sp. R2-1]MBB2961895.1 hypothetical protein [Methylobacterium sp. R2-1]